MDSRFGALRPYVPQILDPGGSFELGYPGQTTGHSKMTVTKIKEDYGIRAYKRRGQTFVDDCDIGTPMSTVGTMVYGRQRSRFQSLLCIPTFVLIIIVTP